MGLLKNNIRRIAYFFSYYFWYIPRKNKLNTGSNGQPLKPGITAVISAKDEEYLMPLCLSSLIGVADQIVCIDNGSSDNTLAVMQRFKEENTEKIEVDVISMPNALLGDCRNAGLKASKYQWHLRWDADMISQTSGNDSMIAFREKVLNIKKPTSFQLPRTNLIGDFSHTMKNSIVIDQGEPFLLWLSKDVSYKEYGKFDAIRIPFYFIRKKEKKSYIFHCQGIKSAENLIHRFHYFTWRELVNSQKPNRYSDVLENLELFKEKRNLFLFETNEKERLTWRYYRQLSSNYEPYDPLKYGSYPEVIKKAMENENKRFEVIYKDNKPYSINDYMNKDFMGYIPEQNDLQWSVDTFFKKLNEEF